MFSTTFCSLLLVLTTFTTQNDAETLLHQFQTIRTSVANQRGLAPGDTETILKCRDEMTAWNSENENFQLIAAELQLSAWLGDTEICNALFQRLTELQPDNTAIAMAWAEFLLTQEGADADQIYGDLANRFPHSTEIVIAWAKTLDASNQFQKAITAMEKLNDEQLQTPDAAELYSSLLFAENRFEESLAALKAIDNQLLVDDPRLSTRISGQTTRAEDQLEKWNTELTIREVEEIADDLPRAIMHTSKGPIELELFEDHAPNTVANFISLADSGFYDGIKFHRVIPKFMAQGGNPAFRGEEDPTADDGPGYSIKDEHTNEDHRKHFAGSLSMAKTSAPDSGGSQFFLTHLPTPHLDGRHTVFGRITSGLSTAREIEKDDEIVTVMIVRKREHEYLPEKIGEETAIKIPKEDKAIDGSSLMTNPNLN